VSRFLGGTNVGNLPVGHDSPDDRNERHPEGTPSHSLNFDAAGARGADSLTVLRISQTIVESTDGSKPDWRMEVK
jgi:hypothetical protein